MSTHIFAGRRVGERLIAAGLCPPNAFNIEIRIGVEASMTLHYDCHASTADARTIARALVDVADAVELTNTEGHTP